MKSCPVCKEEYPDSVTFCANDGEVLEADPGSLVGQKLDNQYYVESLLGKGGMGAVYKARHILLGDRVAIKVLPPEMQSNAEWAKRFQREGQAARRFRHPNAVTVHDLRTTPDGMIYMVMEYIEGRTLAADLQARGRYTAEEAFYLLEPVMSVLHAAHITGVVHRDIKPENIMVGNGPNGQPFVKLLDLGVAKMLPTDAQEAGSGTKLTVQGQLLGTPFYMSPEQWGEPMRDGHAEVDGRADLYSLAVVLHEMVAGHKPFYGLSMMELRASHCKSAPTPLFNLRPDVPQTFSNSVLRALSKDRSDRHPNVQVFADELRDALTQPAYLGGNYAPTPVYAPVDGTIAEIPGAPTGLEPQARSDKATEIVGRPDAATMVDSGADARATIMDAPAEAHARATVVDGADKRTAVPGGPNVGAPPPVVQPVPPPPVVAREKTAPVTPVAQPEPQREIVAPPPAASSGFPLALLAIPLFLMLLAGAGVGGWYFFMRSKPETPAVNNPNPPATALSLQYWLETVDKLDNNNNPVGDTKRLADGAMKSSQSFRLHFKAPANGYLYIVGPGENNAPTTFLTAQPIPESGLSTNRILGGTDFPFPDGAGNWIGFEPKPGTEVYTVIFAPEPLTEPRFLADQAGKVLDLAQWDDFRAKYKANTATLNVNNSGAEPFVAATASQADKPMLFEIRLEHK